MNEVDVLWEKYLLSRNTDHYRDVVACARESLVKNSHYFGELYGLLWEFYFGCFCGGQKPNEDFLKKIDLQSNTKKALLGETLAENLRFRELYYSDLTPQDIASLLGDGVDVKRLEEFVAIFEESNSSKLQLVVNNKLPNFFAKSGSFLLPGTFIFDGCFIGAKADRGLVFIVSLQSPIDAIFFPKTGLLIKSKSLKYEVASRAKKFIKSMPRNVSAYDCWSFEKSSKGFINLIRDKRPYHVVADEISGHHFLKSVVLESEFSIAFLERASFVETDAFNADVIPNESLQEYAIGKVIFSSYHRVGEDEFYESYRNYLIRLAEEHYASDVLFFEQKENVFWIGIAGGEKRAWLEEIDGLARVILYLQTRFGNCKFIFDGWTTNHKPTESDRKNIMSHEAIMHKLVSRCGIKEEDYLNLIGSQILKKIAFAQQSNFFVSCAGTPAFWPSKVCKVPGFVHNSKQMINRVDNTMNMPNVAKVPLEYITDITEDMMVDRWDYVSYSIKPEAFLVAFSEALSRYLKIN